MKMKNWKKDKNYLKKCIRNVLEQKKRETVRFYSVSAEQNLDTTFIADLYKENGVELK